MWVYLIPEVMHAAELGTLGQQVRKAKKSSEFGVKVSHSQPGLHCVAFLAAYVWLDNSEQAVWEEYGQSAVRQPLPIKTPDHAGSGTSVINSQCFFLPAEIYC